jgi:hypothetical protein
MTITEFRIYEEFFKVYEDVRPLRIGGVRAGILQRGWERDSVG